MSDSLRPPWVVAYQAPLSMGFSRQEYWSGMPCPPPGNLPDSRIEPMSFRSAALTGRFFTTWEGSRTAVHTRSDFFHICDLRGREWEGGCQGLMDKIQSFLGHRKEREGGKEAWCHVVRRELNEGLTDMGKLRNRACYRHLKRFIQKTKQKHPDSCLINLGVWYLAESSCSLSTAC